MEYSTGPLTEQVKNEINKAIAEFCGYKNVNLRVEAEGTGLDCYMLTATIVDASPNSFSVYVKVPDYVGSLDAMHKAEECLMHWEYGDVYWFVYKKILESYTYDTFHIPSRYKAEAFMEVLRRFKKSEELDKQEKSNENT